MNIKHIWIIGRIVSIKDWGSRRSRRGNAPMTFSLPTTLALFVAIRTSIRIDTNGRPVRYSDLERPATACTPVLMASKGLQAFTDRHRSLRAALKSFGTRACQFQITSIGSGLMTGVALPLPMIRGGGIRNKGQREPRRMTLTGCSSE